MSETSQHHPHIPVSSNSSSKNRTILHISDLHFGFRFNSSKWLDLKNEALRIKPDLVIVTGDVVNTPWRWMFSTVKTELSQFADELSNAKHALVPIRVIPGNHDTRLTGLIPVEWIVPAAIILAVIIEHYFKAFSAQWLMLQQCWAACRCEFSWQFIAADLLVFVLMGCRLLVTTNLKKALGQALFLDKVEIFPNLQVGIVPFDSASSWRTSWWPWGWFSSARGHVTDKNIVAGKYDVKHKYANSNVVWIAAVHHHPLPLPNDHEFEDMMVMDNAGTLLNELSRLGVKLILHGHKHHQHFARICIDPTRPNAVNVAVLSAGTPTEGDSQGAYRHGFNVIHIDGDDEITIAMYEAEPAGGTFTSEPCLVSLQTDEEQKFQRFQEAKRATGLWCRRMICIADINEFGDAGFRREFYGIQTNKDNLSELLRFTGSVTDGGVEAFRAWTLSDNGPGVIMGNSQRESQNKVSVRVDFKGSGLQKNHLPVDIATQFEGNNAFGLNLWQLKSMRISSAQSVCKTNNQDEWVDFKVFEHIAVEELVLVIKYPDTVNLPKRMELSRDGVFMSSPDIVRMDTHNMVQATIKYPKLGANYQINWDVDGEDDSRIGHQAVAIRMWLWQNRAHLGLIDTLTKLVQHTETSIRYILSNLTAEPGNNKTLQLALFAYNKADGLLECIASNYDNADKHNRSSWKFRFGCGLPGRAFKAFKVAGFIKPTDIGDEKVLGYLRGDAKTIVNIDDIPEESILAFPLTPPKAPGWPYAVLQISTDDTQMQLQPSDYTIEMVRQALMEAWTKKLMDLMK